MSIDDDLEETDMGPAPSVASKGGSSVGVSISSQGIGGKRSVKVKRMPDTMTKRWPDVLSCMLTMRSGKQVLFVRG